MNGRIDHATEAMAGLVGADQFLSEEMPEQTGEHKADVLAVAQVHATLALVEQQRIANLIAVASAETMDVSRKWYPAMPLTYEHMRQEIAAALGIETGEDDE